MQQMKLVKNRDSLQKGLVVFSSETLISHDEPGWIRADRGGVSQPQAYLGSKNIDK